MDEKEFFELVVSMRRAQSKYFRFRTSAALNEAKKLECKVDEEISRRLTDNTLWHVLNAGSAPKQATLFGE